VIAFQVAPAAGAPWGADAMGGPRQETGRQFERADERARGSARLLIDAREHSVAHDIVVHAWRRSGGAACPI
jgi:hypothetical protein